MLRAKGKSRCQGSLRVSRLYAWQIQCPSYALVLRLEAFFGGHVVLMQVRSRSRNSGNGRVSLACVNECLFWGHFASMNQTPDSPFIKAEPFTKFGNWRSWPSTVTMRFNRVLRFCSLRVAHRQLLGE